MLRAALAGFAAGLALAPPAAATSIPIPELAAGPVFAGDRVTWAVTPERSGRDRSVLRTRAGRPGPPLPQSRLDRSPPAYLLGSRSHVALLRSSDCGPFGFQSCLVIDSDLVTGRAGGGPRSVVRTRFLCPPAAAEPETAALDGSLLAFSARPSPCRPDGRMYRLVTRDLASGAGSDRVVARSVHGFSVRIAGRFVAWQKLFPNLDRFIYVYDQTRGRVVRRLDARALGSRPVEAWDVRADGAVAVFMGGQGNGARLGWFPASGGAPRRVPVRAHVPSPYEEFHFAGNRIAYTVAAAGGSVERDGLYLAGLRGGIERIRSFGPKRRRLGQVAFDGRRLAWAEQDVRRVDCHDFGPDSRIPCVPIYVGPKRIVVRRVTGR